MSKYKKPLDRLAKALKPEMVASIGSLWTADGDKDDAREWAELRSSLAEAKSLLECGECF